VRIYNSKLREITQYDITVCEELIKKLTVPTENTKPTEIDELKTQLQLNLVELKKSPREFANFLDIKFKRQAVWCTSVVEREIAHISAGNETAFDPSELVNAIKNVPRRSR
jgi:hypothetical protein